MKHLYRKEFDHAFEADETAKGFHLPGLKSLGPIEVSVSHADGKHWVYLSFDGEFDPEELLAATGYQRVS